MAIKISGMAPLLSVFDMPASPKFYRDVLSSNVIEDFGQSDDSGWLMQRSNDVTLMLNTALTASVPLPDPAVVTAHRYTCIYFGCPDLDAAFEHLRANGVDEVPAAASLF